MAVCFTIVASGCGADASGSSLDAGSHPGADVALEVDDADGGLAVLDTSAADVLIADTAWPEKRLIPPPTRWPATKKIVAIGDLHGDILRTRQVLKIAGAIDDQDNWIGGDMVLVQVGDQLDRGDGEKAILLLLDSLADKAHAAGGAVLVLNGNHETMNVDLYFAYVTPGGFKDFADTPLLPNDFVLQSFPKEQRGRVAAFRLGGPYAHLLAGRNTIQQVGDSVFVHGGVLPHHVSYGIAKINAEISAWMRNDGKKPKWTSGDTSPVWSRHYSKDVGPDDCKLAQQTLDALGAKRIVVAHTVQSQGINSVCNGLVWRVDVGMSKAYGGTPQALKIEGDSMTVLK